MHPLVHLIAGLLGLHEAQPRPQHHAITQAPQPIHSGQPAPQFSLPQIHEAYATAYNPQAGQLGGDFGTPIQGQQNEGYIPMQGSVGRAGISQDAYADIRNPHYDLLRRINLINQNYRRMR